MVSTYTDLTYVRNTGPSTNSKHYRFNSCQWNIANDKTLEIQELGETQIIVSGSKIVIDTNVKMQTTTYPLSSTSTENKGFTLIELLVVVAIIGILAAVGVVAYNGYTIEQRIQAVKSNHKLAVKIIMECQLGNQNVTFKDARNNSSVGLFIKQFC